MRAFLDPSFKREVREAPPVGLPLPGAAQAHPQAERLFVGRLPDHFDEHPHAWRSCSYSAYSYGLPPWMWPPMPPHPTARP